MSSIDLENSTAFDKCWEERRPAQLNGRRYKLIMRMMSDFGHDNNDDIILVAIFFIPL